MNRPRRRTVTLATLGVAAVGAAAAVSARTRSGNDTAGPVIGRLGRARRGGEVVRLGARTGADLALTRARAAFASAEQADRLRAEFELRTAEEVAASLGNMKGALMKLGQMASYLDQGLPEPVRDALAQLQSDAPPMAPELVDRVIAEELGAPPAELFDTWDPIPLAAASIGQVHRAVTREGEAVAVKVQYPGVAEAVAADLENGDLVFAMLGVLFPGLDPAPIIAEIKARIAEELDYTLEAANQRRFHESYEGHPTIHVPAVVDRYCTSRVLTTELATGSRWAEVLTWSQEERDLAAETIYRFAFGGIYRLHAFNGDPHPGNYLFRPGGHVTFLDFGLCKHFTEDEVRIFESMIRAIVFERDVPAFRRIVEGLGLLQPGLPFSDELVGEYFDHFYEFVLNDEVMTMTPEYASESVRRFFDTSGPYGGIMKAANLPPSMVIIQRINLGLFALFGELGATGNWRRMAEEIWPFVDGPPSTPMGKDVLEWETRRATR